MGKFTQWMLASFASILILSACGGSGGGSGGSSANTISGTAATGSPIQSATVTATGANNATATATTTADGTYTISDISGLTFPVRLSISFPEGGAVRTLRSVVAALTENATTKANINPITEVIAENTEGITDAAALSAAISRLNGVLAAILSNYNVAADTNFISGDYVADPSDPVDNALDLLTVSFDNGNLVIQSKVNPGISVSMPVNDGTTANDVTGAYQPSLPADTAYADPKDIKALVDAFGAALARGQNLTAADLDGVLHSDYLDDDGLDKEAFATSIAEEGAEGLKLTVTGYKILRCFADAGSVTDKCYIRVNYTSPTMEGEDFGGTAGDAIVSDFMDLVVERRSGVSGLRFAGGYFKPFATDIKLFNRNLIVVNNDGTVTNNTTIERGLSIYAPVAPAGQSATEPEEIANQNLTTILLVKNLGVDGEEEVMLVTRSGIGQCSGSDGRLNIDPATNACGNQSLLASNHPIVADSAAGLLTAVFIDSDDEETHVANVRVADPTSTNIASFGTLDQTSLSNLIAYAQNGGSSVSVKLTVPATASSVCLSDGGNNEDICVYATRTITIPSTALAQRPSYYVLTRDAENNQFQRQYDLPVN